MKKLDVILTSAFFLGAATANVGAVAFAQGFGDYVAPTQTAPSAPQTLPAVSAQSPSTPRQAPAAPASQVPQVPRTQSADATRPAQRSLNAVAAPQSTQTPQNVQSTRPASSPQNASSAYSPQTSRPTNAQPAATAAQPVRVAQTPSASRLAQPTGATAPTARPAQNAPVANAPQNAQSAPVANAPQNAQSAPVANAPQNAQSAPVANASQNAQSAPVANAFVPPPAHYKLSENDRLKLDEFLAHWENFGKGIKQVSCDVHAMEFDGGVLQQDSKKPVAHNWGLFRFKAPNQLLYHIKGEFSYANVDSGGEAVWQEGKNELKIVLDGKSLTQYDYENKKAVVYPLAEDEQNLDLTMDNGQFPLFFVAKAETLKNRFYLRLVTPASKRQSEVWIEAFPRYARDAQQFQSIVVILGLKDMQPTYMRKVGVNGKSKTDLKFERVEVNKGRWTIEGTVDADWTKEVRPERFSLLRQEAVETNYAQTPNAPAPNAATPTAPVRTATRPDAQKAVR